MGNTVDKQQYITGLEMNLNRTFHIINRGFATAHFVFLKIRMDKIGLMAAGHDHRGPVSRSDIGQSD